MTVASGVQASTERAQRQSVARVLTWMEDRLAEPVDLAQMADVAYMSPYHFLRTFRQITGVPPKQFLAARRVELAKRRLLETERSVLDICYDVGYSSLGTFTRRFTELVGLSPGRFRQLVETFYPDLDSLLAVASSCPLPEGGQRLRSRVERTRPDQVVFAGLFDSPVPQGRPLSCAVLLEDDDSFQLAAPAGGPLWLFAAAMAGDSDPIDLLVGGRAIRAVAGAGPLTVEAGVDPEDQHLRLAPPNPFDPPMLLALPLLLHERAVDLDYEGVLDLEL